MFSSFFKKKVNNKEKNISDLNENAFIITCILVEAALVDENFGLEEKKIMDITNYVNYFSDCNCNPNKENETI